MTPWKLPNLWIYTLAVFKPRLLRPDLFAPSAAAIDWHALRSKGYNAVVIDKDNCLTIPDRDELYPAYSTGWSDLKRAFGPSRVLVVSNSAGTRKDLGGVAAESVSRNLGVPVLIHPRPKPGCAPDILSYLSGNTRINRIREPRAVHESLEVAEGEALMGVEEEEEEKEREGYTLLGNRRKRERTRSQGNNEHTLTSQHIAQQPERPITIAPVREPLKIVVVGDRLSTDVLLARRLRRHMRPSAKQDVPDVLSIVTTELPQPKDVRLLRWVESRWSSVGMDRNGEAVRESSLAAAYLKPRKEAGKGVGDPPIRKSRLQSVTHTIRSIRAWRLPTGADLLRWISRQTSKGLKAAWRYSRIGVEKAWTIARDRLGRLREAKAVTKGAAAGPATTARI